MSFKNEKLLKSQCLGKVAHKYLTCAEYALDHMVAKDRGNLEIYKCRFCKKYHIGHKLGTKRKRVK